MEDLKTFRERVKHYLGQAEVDAKEKRGMTIGDLADALGGSRSELSRQLNGKSPISPVRVQRIIKVLAEHGGIMTKSQAKALLMLIETDFSPADWDTFPLNLLEDDARDNKRILVNDPRIPRAVEPFLGREELVQELIEQLCGNNVQAIALYGKPGVGKTAIATAIARHPTVEQFFQGLILWAGLGSSPDIEGIERRWSNLLHRREAGVGDQPLLLILDDVWDTNHVAKLFRLMDKYNASCIYLITTVPKLLADDISENHSFKIPDLKPEKGLELLSRLAPRIVQVEKKEARALVAAVGNLPLAIWLMGTCLESEASREQPRRIHEALEKLHDYEERLQLKRFTLDLKAFPNLDRNNISLEAVIGVRYAALNDHARQMLRVLSIFPPKPNTFSEDAASAVVAMSGKVFRDQLVDAGLVEDAGGDRYTLHNTIRDFAFSKLKEEPSESKVANERLAYFFAEYVKTRGVQSFDEANINHALEWARDHEQNELYLTLASGMQYFWRDHWRVVESMEHLHKGFLAATTKYKETNNPKSLQSMREVACSYGSTLLITNRLTEAEQVFASILEIAYGDTLDLLSEGIALFNLGIVALHQGNLDEARDKLEKSRSIRSKEQYQDEWALDFVTFCRIAQRRSQLEVLKEHFEQAIEIDRVVKNRRGEGIDLFSLGNIAFIQRKYELAQSKYQEGLVIVEEFQEKIGKGGTPTRWRETILLAKGTVLTVLCETSLFLGSLDIAESYLQQSMKIIQELEHRRESISNLLYSGRLALAYGRKEEANRYYREALRITQEVQDPYNEAQALYYLAILAEYDRSVEQAEGFYRESLKLSRAAGSAPYIADACLRLGYLLLKRGKNQEEACSIISEAIQWYYNMEIKEDEITQEIAKQFRSICRKL